MASSNYRVTSQVLVNDVVTLTLDATAGLYIGWPVRIDGLGSPYDGNQTLTGVDDDTLEVTYAKSHANHALTTVIGQLAVRVAWIDTADVETFLGVAPASPADEAWLADSVDAANKWAYDRRQAAGYNDLPSVAPDPRCKQGTVLKAGELYRQRGSVDSYSSFANLEGVQPISSGAEILRLLGLNRPGIA